MTVGGKQHLWGHWDPFYGWRAWGCAKSGSGGQHTNRLPVSDLGFRQTLEVRTLGCAQRLSPYRPTAKLSKISQMNSTNSQHRKTQDLYWFRPPLWCNTLLQCGGGGLPLGLMKNSYQGKNSLLRLRCSCAWWTCDEVDPHLSLVPLSSLFRFSSFVSCGG